MIEDKIQEAIKPIISIYNQLELDIIERIAEHFKLNEEFINIDYWYLEKLKEMPIKIEGIDTLETISKMQDMGVDKKIIDIFPKNSFEHLINTLEDYYVSKINGIERIKSMLSNWDSKAKKNIIIELMKRFEETGIIITISDLIELVELI